MTVSADFDIHPPSELTCVLIPPEHCSVKRVVSLSWSLSSPSTQLIDVYSMTVVLLVLLVLLVFICRWRS